MKLGPILIATGLFVSPAAMAANPAGMTVPLWEVCTQSVTASGLGAATTQLVAAVANQRVYICDLEISVGAAASTVQLEYGTGAACGTGTTTIGTLWSNAISSGKAAGNSYWRGQVTPVSNALCVLTTGAGPSSVTVFYDQY